MLKFTEFKSQRIAGLMLKIVRNVLVAVLLAASLPDLASGQSDADILDCIDCTVRVQRPNGRGYTVGSGSIFMEGEDFYGGITNYHVAEGPGTTNYVDSWNYGRQNERIKTSVSKSWFTSGKSRDVAVMRIPKDQLDGEMPVIPLAPYGTTKNLEPGQTIFTVGSSNGRWPRLRCGTIVEVKNGLIYYEPTSISGDSGGPVYSADGKTQIGLTAWKIEVNGKKLGLAMSSDRVHDIINGRVSSYDETLPEGAEQIVHNEDLPFNAVRVPQTIALVEVVWRQPGTDPSEDDQDKEQLPPTPPPADLFQKKTPDSSGITGLISRFRNDVDGKLEEQAGLIREIINNRRQYRIEMEKLRQEELARQRAWEAEQRGQWSNQNNFITNAIDQMWWWLRMVGWGVGITTVIAVIAMFFGQPWGSALLWGLASGVMGVLGMVGTGFTNVMNRITGSWQKDAEGSKSIEELEEMIEDLKKKGE